MKVGERYKVQTHEDVMEEFRGKLFTIVRINKDHVIVKLDDDDETCEINKQDWNGLVTNIESWDGNILLHRFIK